MPHGVVKLFKADRHFGFITLESDPSRDLFFHRSELSEDDWTPQTGERVTFVERANHRGPLATDVCRLVAPSCQDCEEETERPPELSVAASEATLDIWLRQFSLGVPDPS